MKPPLLNGNADDFQTPAYAINPLLPYISKDKPIWECAAGKGNLVKAFTNLGYTCFGTDALTGQSFFLYQPNQRFDVIVTNPPFSLKQEFLEHAYCLGKPFAFLLPLTTLETKKRQDLFKKYGLEVILLDRRVNFETPSGNGKGSWFATAWFTWGLNIGQQLTFVKMEDYR
jgi:hypothetical protein